MIPSKDWPRRSKKTFICFKELIGDLKTAVDDDVTLAGTKMDQSNETKRLPMAGMRAPKIVITSPPAGMPIEGDSLARMGASTIAKELKPSDSTPSRDKKRE